MFWQIHTAFYVVTAVCGRCEETRSTMIAGNLLSAHLFLGVLQSYFCFEELFLFYKSF